MPHTFSCFAITASFLLLPARLFAGGPPWLCLPIEGVTADNVKACTETLTTKLESKLWQQPGQYRGIRIQQDRDQWYLEFHMGEDVALHEVEAALKGSGLSIPRDKLRMFGHVVLEIDAHTTPTKDILTALAAMDHVSVAKSENKDDFLMVTVDMPYPVDYDTNQRRGTVGWDTFHRNDLASDQSTRSEPPIMARMLPSYDSFRNLVAKHHAALKDIRWSTNYACRPLGGVTAPGSDQEISTKLPKQS